MSIHSPRRKPSRLHKIFPELKILEAEASRSMSDDIADRLIKEKDSILRSLFHIVIIFFIGFCNIYYILSYIDSSKTQFICEIYTKHYISTEYFSEKHKEKLDDLCKPKK